MCACVCLCVCLCWCVCVSYVNVLKGRDQDTARQMFNDTTPKHCPRLRPPHMGLQVNPVSNRLSKFTCLIFINKNSPVLDDFPFLFTSHSAALFLCLVELNVLGKYSADVCGNQSALPHPPPVASNSPCYSSAPSHAHAHAWQAQLNGRNAFSFPFYQVLSFFFLHIFCSTL